MCTLERPDDVTGPICNVGLQRLVEVTAQSDASAIAMDPLPIGTNV